MLYTYLLILHVMAVMSWMAVMFYQPRLYVYHREHYENEGFVEVVKIQEYKLYKYIGLPAFWASLGSGVGMIILNNALLEQSWMWLKLAVLMLLTLFSFSMEYYRVKLLSNPTLHDGQFFRAYNEVPTLLSILIVAFVIAKDEMLWFSLGVILFFGGVIYQIATLKKHAQTSLKESK